MEHCSTTCPQATWRAVVASWGDRVSARWRARQAADHLWAHLVAGRPVSVEVHPGNTADPSTLQPAVERIKDRFGIDRVVFVGDRGMIAEARSRRLREQGWGS